MAGTSPSLKRKRTDSPKLSEKKAKVAPSSVTHPKDGSTIFLTPIDYLRTKPAHMLTIRQLLYENLLTDASEKRTLQAALMTTYCVEDQFIAPIVQSGVKFCLLTDGGRGGKVNRFSDTYTVIFPKNSVSWGKFHPKLFLLQFPAILRVVVTSANLIKHDWSEIGQVIWFQDFPLGNGSGDFYDSLTSFVSEMIPKGYSMETDLGIDLSQYDFSTAKVKLVSSVPKRTTDIAAYGLGRMHALIQSTQLQYDTASFQFSSISGISENFLTQLKTSFTDSPTAKLNLIYPTLSRVRHCHRGLDAGLTTFLNESQYKSAAFPKASLRQLQDPVAFPEVTGHMSHSKVLIVTTHSTEVDDNSVLYFGSHNLSASAWGRLEKAGSQIFMANYELGVVFLPAPGSASAKQDMVSRLPFKYPADAYETNDEPWMIDLHHPGQDELSQ